VSTSPERALRVLLDEPVPHDLLLHLTGFDTATVQSLGWSGMKSGVLLRTAREAGFQALVTVDRRLEYQQNIRKSGLVIVVLQARSTRMPDLLPLIPALNAALLDIRAGEVVHVAV
jgi:hypothetical protein